MPQSSNVLSRFHRFAIFFVNTHRTFHVRLSAFASTRLGTYASHTTGLGTYASHTTGLGTYASHTTGLKRMVTDRSS